MAVVRCDWVVSSKDFVFICRYEKIVGAPGAPSLYNRLDRRKDASWSLDWPSGAKY
jgi:hypothetical protein